MTLAVAVCVPVGVVLAADSRTVITMRDTQPDGTLVLRQKVLSDATRKVIALTKVPVGLATFGDGHLGDQPVDSRIREFEEKHIVGDETPFAVAEKLIEYLQTDFPEASVGCFVAGYQEMNGTATPHLYKMFTKPPQGAPPVEQLNPANGTVRYEAWWAGDAQVATRLFAGPDANLLPIRLYNLQDAVDFASFLVKATGKVQRFLRQIETVGGDVSVLTVTPDGELREITPRKITVQEM